VNCLVVFLDERWSHLLDWDKDHLLSPENLRFYANAIHNDGAPTTSVFGWPDCTKLPICRPGQFQRVAYNGHDRVHCLKYQAIVLPNGLIAHLYGPIEGRRHDNTLWNQSGIADKLSQYAIQPDSSPEDPPEKRCFQIYGDAAYGISSNLLAPFSGPGVRTAGELAWNRSMGKHRVCVENAFGYVYNQWPFLRAMWKMRVYGSPVGRYYRVGVLLANATNCGNPNQISQWFDCQPLMFSEYFHD